MKNKSLGLIAIIILVVSTLGCGSYGYDTITIEDCDSWFVHGSYYNDNGTIQCDYPDCHSILKCPSCGNIYWKLLDTRVYTGSRHDVESDIQCTNCSDKYTCQLCYGRKE